MSRAVSCLVVTILPFFLAACSASPSEGAVQTAIAQTAAAPSGDSESLPTGSQPHSTPTPKPVVECPDEEVEAYLEELDFILEKWDDTLELAGSTARMSLSPVIQSLQDIKRDARRLEQPACASYLQDLVVVGMETDIASFIAFLAQESDTVVARKMQGAEEVWATVDDEIASFRTDPLAAYLASNVSAEALAQQVEQAEPFVRPDGWQDIALPKSDLVISLPDGWQYEEAGDGAEYLSIHSDDDSLWIFLGVLPEPDLAEFDSDAVRLFALQTELETGDYDYYLEHTAETGVYAQNKAYVVQFARRYDPGDDIEEEIWATVVTPQDDEVLLMVSTDRDDFAQIDLLTLGEVYSSIRQPN